ncbi:MAG: DNA translocase FtsK 4TM domain-containing protein [Bacteroidota bacterium]
MNEEHLKEIKVARSSAERKKQIVAILLIVLALLSFLSIVSYSPADEASADVRLSDLYKVLTGDELIRQKAESTHNWLGLVGAIISNFLINGSFGYSVITFPFLLFAWGWTIIRGRGHRRLAFITSYVLLLVLLISSSMGMSRVILTDAGLGTSWSGTVGDFVASVLTSMLGKVGGAIALLAALLITLMVITRIDLRETLSRLKDGLNVVAVWSSKWVAGWRRRRHGAKGTAGVTIIKREQTLETLRRREKPSMSKAAELLYAEGSSEDVDAVSLQEETASVSKPPDFRLLERTEEEKRESGEIQKAHRQATEAGAEAEIDYVFPSVELLELPHQLEQVEESELKANADLLRQKLAHFDIEIESLSVTPGPVVTLYELVPASDVKVSKIVSLADDIALALQAKGIRILAPIPGRGTVGVEIPNRNPAIVPFRSVLNSPKFRESKAILPMAIGKTISGEVYTDDLSRMPHLLMAGSTGSGKSVGINTILMSFVFKLHPSDVKFIVIDPKKIELSVYAKLRHHFLAVSPDLLDEEIATTAQNAVAVLKSVELEMERRYDLLANAGLRNVLDYNRRVREGRLRDRENGHIHRKLPYLILVIDELADLMLTAAREVEEPIARLAQLSRAVGIHLVLATQRPSVDVITGVIKANFSARIAYQVASKTDSRTILDMNGAEQLLGNGDMLYLPTGSPKPVRIQNAFISPDDVEHVVVHVAKQKGYRAPYILPSELERKQTRGGSVAGGRDELFEEAARLIVRHQQGSVSLLQRRLKVGYSRAARIVDELEAVGIVGAFDGSKAREVLVESEEHLDQILKNLE